MKQTDKILFYLLGFVFLTLLLFSFVHNLAAALLIAFLLLVVLRTVILHLYVRRKRKKVISVAEMEKAFSLMGGEQTDFFFSAIPPAFHPRKTEGGILLFREQQILFIAPNYKFSTTGADDTARFFRLAKKENATHVYILGRYPNRQVLVLGNSFDISFTFVRGKKLHRYLLSRNALPEKVKTVRTRKKENFCVLLENAFTKKRAKYFALSGLTILLFGFFTPMRVYYFIFSGICLLCTFVCLFRKT